MSIITAILGSIIGTTYYIKHGITLGGGLPRFLCFCIPSGLLIYGLQGIEQKTNLWIPRFIQLLGDSSYSLYLVHLTVIRVAFHLLKNLFQDSLFMHFIWIVVMLTCTLLGGFTTYFLFEKPIYKFFREKYSG